MNIDWDVEVSVNVDEPDSDDVLVVARNGRDALMDLLLTNTPMVTVTKTVMNHGVRQSQERFNVDLQDGTITLWEGTR